MCDALNIVACLHAKQNVIIVSWLGPPPLFTSGDNCCRSLDHLTTIPGTEVEGRCKRFRFGFVSKNTYYGHLVFTDAENAISNDLLVLEGMTGCVHTFRMRMSDPRSGTPLAYAVYVGTACRITDSTWLRGLACKGSYLAVSTFCNIRVFSGSGCKWTEVNTISLPDYCASRGGGLAFAFGTSVIVSAEGDTNSIIMRDWNSGTIVEEYFAPDNTNVLDMKLARDGLVVMTSGSIVGPRVWYLDFETRTWRQERRVMRTSRPVCAITVSNAHGLVCDTGKVLYVLMTDDEEAMARMSQNRVAWITAVVTHGIVQPRTSMTRA